MRLLALLLISLSLLAPAAAQDNTTTDGNESAPDANGTATDANATDGDGNETADGANESDGAAEEPAGPIEFILEGHQEGSAVYFTLAGETQRNPTLRVQPGQQVTFIYRGVSGVHNLNVNGEVKTPIIAEGEERVEWTAPMEPGSVPYWCDPHKAQGMGGTIQVGAPPAGGGEGGAITGKTIDLGQYDPACAGRKAPAAAAEDIVGMPSLQDYLDACKPATDVQEDDSHPADYVIPLSWLLVGLGVFGVVWVHKYYKP